MKKLKGIGVCNWVGCIYSQEEFVGEHRDKGSIT